MDIYERLKELNLTLPDTPVKGGIYKPVRQAGNILYLSGQIAKLNEVITTGKLGKDLSVEEGREAAKICTLNALRSLHDYLGDLNKIKGVIKTLVFVQSAEGFTQQPKVADGATGLLQDIWGEDGLGARSAIGVNELPAGTAVEIEFIFEI